MTVTAARYDRERLLVGSRTLNELRWRFVGRLVRTSRLLTKAEYEAWFGDRVFYLYTDWSKKYDFGGEGVVEFIERFGDSTVIGVDYGMQWPIDSLTTIQVVV